MSMLDAGLNHVIFVDGDVLHHLTGRLSCKEPYSPWLLKCTGRGCVMLRKLKLYGELAKFIGHKEFEIKVHSLPQAISFLVNNFPEVEAYMNPKYYQVKIGNYEINER